MRRFLLRLTGGRPMRCAGYAFCDRLSGRRVFYWRDRLSGRLYLAQGAWSLLRVQVPYHHAALADWISDQVEP